MNDFDYVSADPALDDTFGYRCPIGSHIRRTNPRGAAVIARRQLAPHCPPGGGAYCYLPSITALRVIGA